MFFKTLLWKYGFSDDKERGVFYAKHKITAGN